MKMNAPIELEMKVYAVNPESGRQAVLTMSLPLGQYPTRITLESVFKKAEENIPEGFRLMNKSEFFNDYLQREHGAQEKFATPGSREFTDAVLEMEVDK